MNLEHLTNAEAERQMNKRSAQGCFLTLATFGSIAYSIGETIYRAVHDQPPTLSSVIMYTTSVVAAAGMTYALCKANQYEKHLNTPLAKAEYSLDYPKRDTHE